MTLVEVIVAVTLLAVGISACVACIGSAARASARAEEFTAVQLMAREKLTQIELQGVQEGEQQGDFGQERPGYRWRTFAKGADAPGLYHVRLAILWGEGDQPRKVEYVTYTRRGTGR